MTIITRIKLLGKVDPVVTALKIKTRLDGDSFESDRRCDEHHQDLSLELQCYIQSL
jgi:hypothetical protein